MDKETDISQINKYLNGDLDAKARHQLEKRALDDPFLMDALEGFEAKGKDQRAQLDEISQRLKKRTSESEKRIVPWHYFAIAASVLLVATIGGMWLFNQKSAKPQLAKVVVPVTEKAPILPGKAPVDDNDITAAKPITQASQAKVASDQRNEKKHGAKIETVSPVIEADAVAVIEPKKMAADETADKDTTPLNEMIVTEYTSGKKKDISQNVVSTNVMKVKKADTVPAQLLPAQVNGVAFNNVTPRQQGYLTVPQANGAGAMKEVTILHKEYDPGKAVATGQVSAGEKARKRAVHNSDSTKITSPDIYNGSLAEVAVATPAPIAKSANTSAAHPQNGWESLKNYLKENAVSPDQKPGKVTVSFLVDKNGIINNLQIESGLSDATNQKALYLISNGPAWVGNSNGLPQKVKVKIQFSK